MPGLQLAEGTVVESSKEIPVIARADVVVAGGGPAGLTAAVAAARQGATVVLIENNSFLGGVATGAMMAALVGSHWATGIGVEIIDKLADKGAAPHWKNEPGRTATTPFDPEAFKQVALELVSQEGIHLMLYSLAVQPLVIEGRAHGVIVESKSGRQAVLGKVLIDCTGDADLAARSGAAISKGRETDQKMRPFALLFRLGGLDIARIRAYVQEHPEELQPQYREGTVLKTNGETVISRISGFYALVEQAKQQGQLFPECHYFRLENLWVERGTAICNTTRIYDVDGTDAADLTQGEVAGRRQIDALIAFAKKYIPGCENAFLLDVAPRIGVRESRRIIGEYCLTDEDAYNDAAFPDAIMTMKAALVKRPVPKNLDVHMPEPIEGSQQDLLERYPEQVPREQHTYQIPYRVLLPKGVAGLIVAGRSIAVSHMIDGSTRNMLVCMRMGQVAGVAAALAAHGDVCPKQVDIQQLRETLAAQGLADL